MGRQGAPEVKPLSHPHLPISEMHSDFIKRRRTCSVNWRGTLFRFKKNWMEWGGGNNKILNGKVGLVTYP